LLDVNNISGKITTTKTAANCLSLRWYDLFCVNSYSANTKKNIIDCLQVSGMLEHNNHKNSLIAFRGKMPATTQRYAIKRFIITRAGFALFEKEIQL